MKKTTKPNRKQKRPAIKPGVNIPPVRRSFYTVMHTWKRLDEMEVLILGRTRKLAISAYEKCHGLERGKLTEERMHAYQLTVKRVPV